MKRRNALTDLPEQMLKEAAKVGVVGKERSGTYFQLDGDAILETVNERFRGKLELMGIEDALEKYDWAEDLYWRLIDPDKDECTRAVEKDTQGGYFMRILPGAELTFPLQSCLMVSQGFTQRVHNMIVAEEGSAARIITGCARHPKATGGTHLGVSEIYVNKGASLHFTMIHDWGEETVVRPRSVAQVGEGAEYVSNYISLKPLRDIQMYPAAVCEGEKSVAVMNTLVFATGSSSMDLGNRIALRGRGSKGEIVSRSVAKDDARLTVRGRLEGEDHESKGHLECRSLLQDSALVHAIPELVAGKEGTDLSHEAAVGKIAGKELTYLMSRGLSEEGAVAAIVRGFLDVKILGLPDELEEAVKRLIDETVGAG